MGKMKFKIGDKVKIISIDFETAGGLKEEDIGKICEITKACEREIGELWDIYLLDNNKYSANFPESSITLVNGKTLKAPTHLVIWDEQDQDPHQFFTSEPDAKNFMKELSVKPGVKQDSVILVTIKSAEKVSITKIVRLKGYKI